MAANFREEARIFKAFCDERRLQILELLRKGQMCACALLEELTISQSTLSHHMKILVESGIVEAKKEGKWMHYSLSGKGLNHVERIINRLQDHNNGPFAVCT